MPRHAIGGNSSNCRPATGLRSVGLAAMCVLAVSCSSKDKDLIGFGKYKLGETVPADKYVTGKCQPKGKNTFCFLNKSPSIAKHKTQTDLYFQGHDEKTAPLIEISVGVWDCQPEPVAADLREKLGPPTEEANKRVKWVLDKMTVVALLPKDHELCMVHFLVPTDTNRIAQLFTGAGTETTTAGKPESSVPEPAPAGDAGAAKTTP